MPMAMTTSANNRRMIVSGMAPLKVPVGGPRAAGQPASMVTSSMVTVEPVSRPSPATAVTGKARPARKSNSADPPGAFIASSLFA